MAASSLIVTVNILKSTRVVSQQAFNVPAIFGTSARFIDAYRVYTNTAAMLADGFLPSDPEYIEAVALMAQAIKPSKFVVSHFTNAVAQVDTLAINSLTVGHPYSFTLNGTVISYTALLADTEQSVLAALLSAIGTAFPVNPPVTGAVTGTGPSALLTLTASVPGAGISYIVTDAKITHAAVTPNHSIIGDIAAAQSAVSLENQFYGVIVTSHLASDIEQVAAYIETQLLVYVTATNDAGVLSNAPGNIMAVLKARAYDRTIIMYSAEANTHGPDGAWMGYMLPTTPGIGNWAMKTLVGVTADTLTPTQIGNILSNNGNIYVVVGGNGCTLYGIAPGADYFDVTIFIDWLTSTIQNGVIAVETDPLNLKIPYTNQGITMIENPIRHALKQGQDNQGIVPGWTVTTPDITQISKADKSDRTLNGISFDATLAGAINQINIQGYVSS